MKKKLFIFALLVLVTLLPLTVFAQGWSVNDDLSVIENGDTRYNEAYFGDFDFLLAASVRGNSVEGAEGLYVYEDLNNDSYVVLSEYSWFPSLASTGVYITDEGYDNYLEFSSGVYGSYLLSDSDYDAKTQAALDAGLVALLESGTLATDEIDVRTLAGYNCFQLLGVDKTNSFAHLKGAIYGKNGAYFYVDYDALDNSYFNSDGYFSYRRGTVTVTVIPESYAETVTETVDAFKTVYTNQIDTFSDSTDYSFINEQSARVIFIVISVLMGIILPLIPLVLGIIFAHSKRSLHPKRWYILSACALLWMLTAVLIIILFLV